MRNDFVCLRDNALAQKMQSVVGRLGFEQLVKVLDRVPLVAGVRQDLAGLRELLYDRRPPRIAAIGSTGSGRSTLLRALVERSPDEVTPAADHGEWVRIEHEGTKLDWLELTMDDPAAVERWRGALDKHLPDVVLWLITPVEQRKGVDAIVRNWSALQSELREGESPPRTFVLLGHADTYANDHAREEARRELSRRLREAGVRADPPRAISTRTGRGLDGLSEAMFLALPPEAMVEGARALSRAHDGRRRVGQEIVKACSAVSVTVALTPIPFSDMAILAPLQALMVSSVAYLSGRAMGKKTVAEWVTSLGLVGGLGVGLRYTAQQLAKFFPGAGNVLSASVAGAGTTAIGQSAVSYFLRESN